MRFWADIRETSNGLSPKQNNDAMIGKLEGVIDYRSRDHLMIVAGGVGYEVYCSERTLSAVPGPGGRTALFTDLLVKENLVRLYGFRSRRERELHRLLMTVQGVGAAAALAISGALGVEGCLRAIALGDWQAIKEAYGVGPRLAQRVANELQGKTESILEIVDGTVEADGSREPAQTDEPARELDDEAFRASADALSALANLGYARSEAARVVAEIAGSDPDFDASALIRAALKRLDRR